MKYFVGTDTGGTFTDTIVMDENGHLRMYKTHTTPHDRSIGIMKAVSLAANDLGVSENAFLENVSYFGHGSTAATNAFIERKGVRTGLITTEGFGDTMLIQRTMGQWAGLGDQLTHYSIRKLPDPIIPKHLIAEVPERIDYKGAVIVALNEQKARQAVRSLLGQGVEAIAVSLLWSFANPVHEQLIKRIVQEEAPGIFLSISSETAPVLGEYERTATTAINAYLGPSIDSYVTTLEDKLKAKGFNGIFTIMNSNGGVIPAEEAREAAVSLLTSGPAGGVLASVHLAGKLGYPNVITSDMGGTSFDVGLIIDGKPIVSNNSEVESYHIVQPMVKVTAIGAGGGSIAYVENGHLFVGPQSAGAVPGPVCYDQGGTEPTITDADVVLGIIDPDHFLGGKMKLNKAKAEDAIRTKIAEPLGMTVVEAAAGIRTISDNRMADLLRQATISQGHDPRDFVLFAYGGAGPAHSYSFGAESGVKAIIVPYTATVHSAYGIGTSDIHRSYYLSKRMQTPAMFQVASDHISASEFNKVFEQLEEKCEKALINDFVTKENVRFSRLVDLRFRGQFNQVSVEIEGGELTAQHINDLIARFEQNYEERYGNGTGYREAGIEITGFRVHGKAPVPKATIAKKLSHSNGKATPRTERNVYFHEVNDFMTTYIYNEEDLEAGMEITGPAIIEHPGTTIVIGPQQKAMIDEYLNTVILPEAILLNDKQIHNEGEMVH
ncbi:N-methylhydantoinase A [Neobacillus niacini]|uniref:hydantoinase/oxoprolinase family protein n=1 Tax=Neobacillus niacini TaxID=86668 RepID=UPI002867654E|nr:hydantoinase/oxoprolinase family protein [Neobacillus niacini]MDR7075194.1 N-methylhydantoinase A [Neobacillus niacini]